MVPASGNEGEKEGTKGQENKKGWRTRSTKKESGLREGREKGGRGKGGGEGSVGKAKRKRPRSRGTCARRRAQTAANDEGVRRADCGRGGCLVEARGEGAGGHSGYHDDRLWHDCSPTPFQYLVHRRARRALLRTGSG